MKYEPLKEKKQKIKKEFLKNRKKEDEFFADFEKAVDECFNAFSSHVNMYNRYKDDVKLLMNEQKPVWKKWVEHCDQKNIDKTDYIVCYNNWLFDYFFTDVNGGSSSFLSL